MPRHRKVNLDLSEVWIGMMTTGVSAHAYDLGRLFGVPGNIIVDELVGWQKIDRAPSADYSHRDDWRLRPEYQPKVLHGMEAIYARHFARGYKRKGWSLDKMRKAIDALEHAWTMVQLGATGSDTAKERGFSYEDWTNDPYHAEGG